MAIDEKKLIDALEDDMDSLFPRVFGKVHPNDAFGLYLELKAMIDNQPKISLENKTSDNDVPDTNVGKWIPCCERLPDEPEEYPDYGHRFSESVLCSVSHPLHDDCVIESFTMDGEWLCEKGTMLKVIAWMPLPEPYKGEE